MPTSNAADATGDSAEMPETPDDAVQLDSELAELMAASGDTLAEVDEEQDAGPLIPRHPVVLVLLLGLPLLAFGAYGLSAQAFITAFAAGVLVVLAAIDIEHRVIPNEIVLPAAAIVLVAQTAANPDQALQWLLGSLGAAAFLALPMIVRRDAMGMGDVKLGLLIGAATGWAVVGAIFIGCLAIVPVAGWMLFRDGSIRNATLPFGPFLAIGTIVILFTQ